MDQNLLSYNLKEILLCVCGKCVGERERETVLRLKVHKIYNITLILQEDSFLFAFILKNMKKELQCYQKSLHVYLVLFH